MTRTAAARRPGLSLLEVIVALFVMALGMISLLTLFPLGAIQMGQALRDARAAETCSQADTLTRLWWQRDVVEQPGTEDVAFAALDDPRNTFDPTNTLAALTVADNGNPSYPVAIDPLGWQARNGLGVRQYRFAGGFAPPTNGLFPRRTMQWIAGTGRPAEFSFRTATMMDDITFAGDGTPDTGSTTVRVTISPGPPPVTVPTLARQGRYNWAAVIQRPVNANRYVADLKILVFDGRSPGIAPADAERAYSPTTPLGIGTTQIVLNVGATPPDHLRAGNWIMDGTLANAGAFGPTGVRNAVWYRIQTIDKDSLPNAYIIDLQTPLVRNITTASQFYAFKGLLEVFDRPQLAPPDYKKQVP